MSNKTKRVLNTYKIREIVGDDPSVMLLDVANERDELMSLLKSAIFSPGVTINSFMMNQNS